MTATDSVFERLLADILNGTYPSGARLPAERDLAKLLGASRPTLREALRRLGEWNLVKARRGSGIDVQHESEWTIDVLPSYLRYAEGRPGSPSGLEMVRDLLHLRRSLVREILGMVASRVPPEATAKARQAVREAWSLRHDSVRFAPAELNIMRNIVHAASFLPGLWMLNQMSSIQLDLAKTLGAVLAPPEGYVAAWDKVLNGIEAQDPQAAITCMDHQLQVYDERLMALLELSQ